MTEKSDKSDWHIKCSLCGTETAIYYCNARNTKCDNRVLCQRCILKHAGNHSQYVLLLEDLLGMKEKGTGDDPTSKLQHVLEKISTEQDNFESKKTALTERVDQYIQEVLETVKSNLEAEKEQITTKFVNEFDTTINSKHKELTSQLTTYKGTQEKLKGDESVKREEIDQMLSELAEIHQKYEAVQKDHKVEGVKAFNSKWHCEPGNKEEVKSQVKVLIGKMQSEFSKLLRTNSYTEPLIPLGTPFQQPPIPLQQPTTQSFSQGSLDTVPQVTYAKPPVTRQQYSSDNLGYYPQTIGAQQPGVVAHPPHQGNATVHSQMEYYQTYVAAYPFDQTRTGPMAPFLNGRISILSSPPAHEKIGPKSSATTNPGDINTSGIPSQKP